MDKDIIESVVRAALKEDLPEGDITSENLIPSRVHSQAFIESREKGVLAGLDIAEKVFHLIDSSVDFQKLKKDGEEFGEGDHLVRLEGASVSLLKGERTALNFLQRLSGIATRTRQFVQAVKGTSTQILDTRKTTPGLRMMEKYAVRTGGGRNHRFNLSEMVLIKDNHLQVVGSIREAVQRAQKRIPPEIKIEVETSSLEQVKEAVQSGADMVMLDNMSLEEIKRVLDWGKGKVLFEVSGNIELSQVKAIALLGVDYISVGSLTHSFKSMDISMEFLS